jgi:hypothetical protein
VGNSESRTQRILRVSSRLPRLGQAIQQEENRSRQLPEHEESNERKMKHETDTQWVNHSHPRAVGSHSEANIA